MDGEYRALAVSARVPATAVSADERGLDTESLVVSAQQGDREAFDALVRRYDDEVRRAASRMLGDADDGEDLAQEVWLRVADKLQQLNHPSRFRAWLLRMVRNACLNTLRADRTRREDPYAPGEGPDHGDVRADPSPHSYPERELLLHDDQRKVWEALGALSDGDREMLRLRELDHLGYGEIARILSTTSHAAEMRGARARDRFRSRYGVIDDGDRSCATSPLRLRALVDAQTKKVATTDAHVATCRACRARVIAMRLGRSVFTGLAEFVLAPLALWRAASELRHDTSGLNGAHTGVALFTRASTLAPVLESSGTDLSGIGSMVAGVTFSIALALFDGSAVTDTGMASMERAGTDAIPDGSTGGPPKKFAFDVIAAAQSDAVPAVGDGGAAGHEPIDAPASRPGPTSAPAVATPSRAPLSATPTASIAPPSASPTTGSASPALPSRAAPPLGRGSSGDRPSTATSSTEHPAAPRPKAPVAAGPRAAPQATRVTTESVATTEQAQRGKIAGQPDDDHEREVPKGADRTRDAASRNPADDASQTRPAVPKR